MAKRKKNNNKRRGPTPRRRPKKPWWRTIEGASLILGLLAVPLALVLWRFPQSPETPFTVTEAGRPTLNFEPAEQIIMSPDGRADAVEDLVEDAPFIAAGTLFEPAPCAHASPSSARSDAYECLSFAMPVGPCFRVSDQATESMLRRTGHLDLLSPSSVFQCVGTGESALGDGFLIPGIAFDASQLPTGTLAPSEARTDTWPHSLQLTDGSVCRWASFTVGNGLWDGDGPVYACPPQGTIFADTSAELFAAAKWPEHWVVEDERVLMVDAEQSYVFGLDISDNGVIVANLASVGEPSSRLVTISAAAW